MKQIKSIEMASDNDVYEIAYGSEIETKNNIDDYKYTVFVAGEEVDYCNDDDEYEAIIKLAIIDNDLIIKGFGANSGRKFWQLPEKLQDEIIALAKKN